MKTVVWMLAAGLVTAAGSASAGSKVVEYGPVPSWVTPPPAVSPGLTPPGAPVRVVYLDNQVRLTGGKGIETYSAYAIKILKPEALSAGNVMAAWNPATDDLIVHSLKIVRGGQVIDVLATTKFRVIERENELELSKLDGALSAVLQVPGLQVGDELEFAATLRHVDPIFDDRAGGVIQLPVVGSPGAYRARIVWPAGDKVVWRTTQDLGQVAPHAQGREEVLTTELHDPSSIVLTEGAPDRYNVHRVLQASEFTSWGDISHQIWPLFDAAAHLAPNSPVRAEAARIAASTTDPAARAEAALQLVQDRIRYVYVGLNGGNYRPATADETWSRRFGDCKAKTVLLIAILRELGIKAEPVLVNSKGGDAISKMLPNPAVFDHVLVRAEINGKPYWLDGTRMGDRRLAMLPTPASHWDLPLRAGPAELEAVEPRAPEYPSVDVIVDIDATAGFDKPAKYRVEDVFRGDEALKLKTGLSALSKQDAERAVEQLFRNGMSNVDPQTAAWRYEEMTGALVLSMTGEGRPDWEGDDKEGRSLDIMGAGFTPPDELKRPPEQDQSAPWVTHFPKFKRWTTIIRLPDPGSKWRWTYNADPVDMKLGGVSYWREAELKGNVVRTTMSIRNYMPEITAAQAREISERLPTFNNRISQVYEVAPGQAKAQPAAFAISVADVKGLTERKISDPAKAARDLAALDHEIASSPEDRSLFIERGLLLSSLGRQDEALADVVEAWRIDPLDPSAISARATVLERMGKAAETKDMRVASEASEATHSGARAGQ